MYINFYTIYPLLPIPSKTGEIKLLVHKGTIAWDGFLYLVYSKFLYLVYRELGFHFFYFGRILAAFSVFGECARIFQQLMGSGTPYRVNISTMGDGILYHSPKKTKCNQNFLPVPRENITQRILLRHIMSRILPNSVNIGKTWKKIKILSLDRMQWAKKPSQATVLLNQQPLSSSLVVRTVHTVQIMSTSKSPQRKRGQDDVLGPPL